MEDFFIYHAKSCGLLFLFWLVFKLILSKETFFDAHRLFLIGGIFTAVLLPFVIFKKIVFIEAPKFQNIAFESFNYAQVVTPKETDWWEIAFLVYLVGVILLSFRLLLQLFSLYSLFKKCKVTKQGKYNLAITEDHVSPFSFFNTIVYNPTLHTTEELKAILIHEQIHSKQYHSLDILLAHLLTIFQWMNPFSWIYKKTKAQNLEYIADKYSVAIIENKKNYQYLLLHQSGQVAPKTTLINPFFNLLIKKRIVMLNQQQSNEINLIKYSIILPLIAVFLFAFNTETIAQVKEQGANESPWRIEVAVTSFEIIVDKNATDEELDRESEALEEDGISLKFSKIKRNSKGEITRIKSTYKNKDGQSGEYVISGNNPIETFSFYINSDKNGNRTKMGYKSNNKNNSVFIFSTNDENDTINKNSKRIVTSALQGADIILEDLPLDSIFNTLDIQQIKNIKMIKNEDGKTANIIISEKNFKNWNEVPQMELPASTKNNTNFNDAKNPPIYIIDGEISENSALNNLNIDTIESLSVLKDKSATAVYGDKGKNGVIIITTKKVKNKTNLLQKSSDKALYIIDGEMIKGNPESIGLKPNDIASVMVLKDKSATELYGDRGENGVIQIITKKAQKNKDKTQNSLEKALFVVDGEITSDINNIQPDDINAMNVLKGEAAIKKYGTKGVNGVIEIETKKEIKIIGYGTNNESTTRVSDLNSKTADNFYVEAKKISKDGKTYISGKVFTSNSVLPGVTIIIENSKSGTITNFDGQFTIAAEEGQTLLFQYLGFLNTKLKITKDENYAVTSGQK